MTDGAEYDAMADFEPSNLGTVNLPGGSGTLDMVSCLMSICWTVHCSRAQTVADAINSGSINVNDAAQYYGVDQRLLIGLWRVNGFTGGNTGGNTGAEQCRRFWDSRRYYTSALANAINSLLLVRRLMLMLTVTSQLQRLTRMATLYDNCIWR